MQQKYKKSDLKGRYICTKLRAICHYYANRFHSNDTFMEGGLGAKRQSRWIDKMDAENNCDPL